MTGTPGFWHLALKDFALKSYSGLDVLSKSAGKGVLKVSVHASLLCRGRAWRTCAKTSLSVFELFELSLALQ